MNEKIKAKVESAMYKALARYVQPNLPDLNIGKIATFYVNALEFILTILSTIILILTFTWYFPTMYGMQPTTAIIILMCIILVAIKVKNDG